MFKELKSLCEELENEFSLIEPDRKKHLLALSQFFQKKFEAKETARAIVICTHNSRRSHLGQLWLSVGAEYYGFPKIETFSGGTEATAFNPRAVLAAQKVGFKIETKNPEATNPLYEIQWNAEMDSYQSFSKKFDDSPNPTIDFAAIMVCTSADVGCPFVPGTSFRIALPYDDPKAFDDTDLEAAKYTERLRQIGREMLWMFSMVK